MMNQTTAETTSLFWNVMKGEWDEVEKICENDIEALRVKITKSGNTALHVAVEDGQEDTVRKLVALITDASDSQRSRKLLEIQNERGNTPLHYAAFAGNVAMCECITRADPLLAGIQNKDGETPLFLAALRGKKDAFEHLHSACGGELQGNTSYWRRKDGQTFLHCAINGEYFDMALKIIELCPHLANTLDAEGLSPLHILASKPSAFESGSSLGPYEKIIYKCISVKLESDRTSAVESKPSYPENYRTGVNLCRFLRNAVLTACIPYSDAAQEADTENPEQQQFLGPANYYVCFQFLKLTIKTILIIFVGFVPGITYIREEKKKHKWAYQVMVRLLYHAEMYDYKNPADHQSPPSAEEDHHDSYNAITDHQEEKKVDKEEGSLAKKDEDKMETALLVASINSGVTKMVEKILEDFSVDIRKKDLQNKSIVLFAEMSKIMKDEENSHLLQKKKERETAILIAARNGVTELVKEILKNYPIAIHDIDSNKRNIALLAVEYRQLEVYKLLLNTHNIKDSVFGKVDFNGNSVLHFAAKLEPDHDKPWPVPGDALQMQWEFEWYKFIENSMPPRFFVRYNNNGETPEQIFTKSHEQLVIAGSKWMAKTAQSCSVVAVLIATVAFATTSDFPGSTDDKTGEPTLITHPAFKVFAISSLIALCFSVSSLIMFLCILTSRYQESDFAINLPWKLLYGLTSLFVAITSMLVSFSAGHFFVVQGDIKYVALFVYATMSLPVIFFATAQFPLYFDLLWAIFRSPFGEVSRSSK